MNESAIIKRNSFLQAVALDKDAIHLSDIVKAHERYAPAYITASLGALVAANGGEYAIIDGTSHPAFDRFLDALNIDLVGDVVIGSRTDRNENVGVTLDCSLHLPEGALSVRPDWTAYKGIRADEIMTTLLRPLRKRGMLGRATIKTITGREKSHGDDIAATVAAVLSLDGHDEQYDDKARERFVSLVIG